MFKFFRVLARRILRPRRNVRRSLKVRIQTDFGDGRFAYNCWMFDLSATGALVESMDGRPLPDRFRVIIDRNQPPIQVEVIRRIGAGAGIRFVS